VLKKLSWWDQGSQRWKGIYHDETEAAEGERESANKEETVAAKGDEKSAISNTFKTI